MDKTRILAQMSEFHQFIWKSPLLPGLFQIWFEKAHFRPPGETGQN